jgi:ferredoxin
MDLPNKSGDAPGEGFGVENGVFAQTVPMPPKLPHIHTPRCTGCGWCVAACPPGVLSLQVVAWRKHAVLPDEQGCTGCSQCERRCPFGVITMVKSPGLGVD